MALRKATRPDRPLEMIGEASEFLGESKMRRWDASGRAVARRHPVNGYPLDAAALVQLRTEIWCGRRAA